MQVLFKRDTGRKPKISFLLLDWSCRESFHALDYLNDQDLPRDDYQIIWIEFYSRISDTLRDRLREDLDAGRPPCIDDWIVTGIPENCYYHKHLMYNIGIVHSRGDIVVLCDSDAMFERGFARRIASEFERRRNIIVHVDQIRNERKDLYPFRYPSFAEVRGEGAINFIEGTTTGLRETADILHTRNYGACFAARRDDLIAVGGADECLDYVGHVCGPYDLTFRLVNHGRQEVWLDDHFIYHTWHPGTDGDMNYIGPNDGRNMSTTALEAIRSGRVRPLNENAAIRTLREGATHSADDLQIVDPNYPTVLRRDVIAASDRFRIFDRSPGDTRLLRELDGVNLLFHDGHYYVVLQSLGSINFHDPLQLSREGIDKLRTHAEMLALLRSKYGLALPDDRLITGSPYTVTAGSPVALNQSGPAPDPDLADRRDRLDKLRDACAADRQEILKLQAEVADASHRLAEREAEVARLESRETRRGEVPTDLFTSTLPPASADAEAGARDLLRHGSIVHSARIPVSGPANGGSTSPGYMIRSPIGRISAGTYHLWIGGRCAPDENRQGTDAEVATVDGLIGDEVFLRQDLHAADIASGVILEFELSDAGPGDAEIRFYNHATAEIELTEFSLVRVTG